MLKKLVSMSAAVLTAVSAIPLSVFLVSAEATAFPYTIFAASDSEPAVSLQANYGCVNGKIAANGTVQKNASGLQLNGKVTEYAEQEMIYVLRKLNETYFQTESVVLSDTDYSEKKTNLTVKKPLKTAGSVSLNGNINLKTQIMAANDIILSGSSLNTTTAALISETGNITADMGNFSFTGLIYAPNGEVTITADSINLNSVVVIAQKVTLNCSCLNANYHAGMADLIGTESEEQIDDHHDDAKPAFVAIALFDEENNAIKLMWDQPDGIKSFDIRTSDDGSSYQLFTTVEDACEYTYEITEPFDEKYFVVSYTDAEGETVESPAICVKNTDSGYVIQLSDTDGDGLNDVLEALYGTDISKPDTDEDGLSDFDEVFRTGTDPAVFVSVTVGVSDADADMDEDGLTNLEEVTLGTDPRKADTDGEGLTDGDEVNEYHTDPLLPDTDQDGVDDASEIALGLDPLKDQTFGDPDASHVFPQTVPADSDAFLTVNTEDSPYEMSVSLKTNLLAEKHTVASESVYAASVSNDAMLGKCTDLTFDEACTVSDVVVTFAIKPAYVDNTLGTFADIADMAGIKRLCVFAFDESLNMLVPVETEYDTEHNTISAAVDGRGSYCVMDLEIWLDMLGISPDDLADEEEAENEDNSSDAEPAAAAPRRALVRAAAPAPAAPDTPSYTTYEFNGNLYAIFELNKSWEDCKTYCESLGGHLATITSAEEQAFLNTTVLPHGTKNTYFVGLTRADAFSSWQWVTGEPVTYYNWDSGEPNYDHEHWVHIYRKLKPLGTWNNTKNYVEGTTPYSTYMAGCICEWDTGAPTYYNVLVGLNYKTVRLKSALRENGLTDTDGDSLSDWAEVDTSRVTIKEDGTVKLPALSELYGTETINKILNKSFPNEAIRRGMSTVLKNKKVLPCLTDPTKEDTDDDGYADVSDPDPTTIPEGLEGEYDFMHNEIYSLKAVTIMDDIRLDYGNSAGVLTASYIKGTDVQKFRFVWCGDGYKLVGLNSSKVLTVKPDSTRFSAFMETDRNSKEQKWEVLPYYDEDENRMGIVIRSKIFDYTNNPLGDPIYLNYQNQDRVGVLPEINRYCVFGISNMADWSLIQGEILDFAHDGGQWIRFGELYMQFRGWIDYTVGRDEDSLSDLSRAFMNYTLNKRYKFNSNDYVKDKDTGINVLAYQHDSATFEKMEYADTKMSDVACEIIGTYNAIRMAEGSDDAVKFLRLAVEFEMRGIRTNVLNGRVTNTQADNIYVAVQEIISILQYKIQRRQDPNAVYSAPNFDHLTTTFTNEGGWGSWPQLIGNCLNAYYLNYKTVRSASDFDTEIKKTGVKCGIQSYLFSHFGIHTYAVNYSSTDSMLHAYNFYCGKDYKETTVATTADLLGGDQEYYWGYVLS